MLRKKLNHSIFLNGKELDFSYLIRESDSGGFSVGGKSFSWVYVNWNVSLGNEYSRYYFLDSNSKEKFKSYTTYNKKGDKFYHSIYVESDFFDDYIISQDKENEGQVSIWDNQKQIYKLLIGQLDRIIYNKRKPYIKEYSKKIIADFDEAKAFDFLDKNNPVGKFKDDQLRTLIQELYVIQPKLFAQQNKEQKITFVRLLDAIENSGNKEDLFRILDGVLDMSPDEQTELAELLALAPLSRITKTINFLVDRLKTIDYFEKMVYQANLHANEVTDLQKMLEENFWLFGEQYLAVAAAETNFVKLVEKHLFILRKDDGEINKDILEQIKANPDRYKQVDLCATRQLTDNKYIENIIVEIKHPQLKISVEHYNQVRNYMDILTSVKEFVADNYKWTFFLIGADISRQVQDDLDNMRGKGKDYLIFEKYNIRVEIYVRTWKSIFNEYRIKYKNLYDKLKIEEKNIASDPKNKQELHELQKKLLVV